MRAQLIIEGGGMRGVYTSGVLDYFLDMNLKFENIIGVSAGSCNAISYLSAQKGRQATVFIKYSHNKQYLSVRNLIKTGSFFGVDYIFNVLQNEILPFDYDAFHKNKGEVCVVLTDINTGQAFYHNIEKLPEDVNYIIASSSLPLISKIVVIDGKKYLDGGMADPIPLKHSLDLGFEKQVLILTRGEEYRKKIKNNTMFSKVKYHKYPNFVKTLKVRNENYNKSLDLIKKLKDEKKIFVIRPSEEITIDRYETNEEKLQYYYDLGYNDAKQSFKALQEYLKDVTNISKFE